MSYNTDVLTYQPNEDELFTGRRGFWEAELRKSPSNPKYCQGGAEGVGRCSCKKLDGCHPGAARNRMNVRVLGCVVCCPSTGGRGSHGSKRQTIPWVSSVKRMSAGQWPNDMRMEHGRPYDKSTSRAAGALPKISKAA